MLSISSMLSVYIPVPRHGYHNRPFVRPMWRLERLCDVVCDDKSVYVL